MANDAQNERNACGFIKERLGTVGGQAVLEGVMMKSKDKIVSAMLSRIYNMQNI